MSPDKIFDQCIIFMENVSQYSSLPPPPHSIYAENYALVEILSIDSFI
jgi:hypothetical protein